MRGVPSSAWPRSARRNTAADASRRSMTSPPSDRDDAFVETAGAVAWPIDKSEFQAAMDSLCLPPGGRMVVACSGGPDSMALAFLMKRWGDGDGRGVHALIVDHGLRRESAVEAAETKARLNGLGIPSDILTYDGPRPDSDIQAAAREIRYRLITSWMERTGDTALFLAHHQDDQAETFMLRLGRGSGVDGLSGMAPVTNRGVVTLYRPLLTFPKARLIATLAEAGVAHADDPSNRSDAFARVRLRGLMDTLASEGMTPERLAGTAARMARVRRALDCIRDRFLDRHASVHPAGFAVVDPAALSEQPEEISLRVLSHLIRLVVARDYPPREAHVSGLLSALGAEAPFTGRTLAGVTAAPWRRKLLLCREAAAIAPPVALADGAVWDGRFRIILRSGGVGMSVGALGADGVRQAKQLVPDAISALPAIVRPGLPAIRSGDRLICVPHLGFAVRRDVPDGEIAPVVPFGAKSRGNRPEVPFSNTPQDLI